MTSDLRLLLVFFLTLPLWGGCDGCRQSDSEADSNAAQKKDSPSEEFTFASAVPLPAGKPAGLTAIKPGHWFSLRQSIRSNLADQRGDLSFRCFPRNVQASTPFDAPGMFSSERPAVLPKGRAKRLDVRLLAGPAAISNQDRISTTSRFSSANINSVGQRVDHIPMRSAEYFFAILTKRPERFAIFQAADWVKPPMGEEGSAANSSNYRIVFPRASGVLALPETMLDWTSTAYLFWDDVSPSELTSEQRRALSDWLHFGGRMIINGDTVATELASSELAPLLPIKVDGMTDLDSEAAARLVESWSVASDDSKSAVTALVRGLASRVAVNGELAVNGNSIPGTAELLTSLPVGRGEVVMSRFDLTSDWLTGWRSLDSFVNAAVLARPSRRYAMANESVTQSYRDARTGEHGSLATVGGPLVNTSLRLTSRDVRFRSSQPMSTTVSPSSNSPQEVGDKNQPESVEGEFVAGPVAGVGAWRDDSDAALHLQSLLRERSGVSIPPLPFVLKSLAIYLLILVPANYVVFWLLGRLEWAWVAVPFLALLGAGWIARSVSLDLGLARNRSEVSLVEMQPHFSRGHVTRFVSLYNSLSATYAVQFDSVDVAAAPAGVFDAKLQDASQTVFRHGYEKGPTLTGFSVPSNRTRVFHAEQLIDFGGAIRLDGDAVRNESNLLLLDVVALRKKTANAVEMAFIERLEPGTKAMARWMDASESSKVPAMLAPFAASDHMLPGSAKLVARCEDELPGMTVMPEMPRQSTASIVLAHLSYPARPRPQGDENLMPRKREREKLMLETDAAEPAVQEQVVP